MNSSERTYHSNYQGSRRIVAYPRLSHAKIITAYAHQNEMSKSEAATYVIIDFINRMNPVEKEKLLKHFEAMTPQQRKNPRPSAHNSY